jgi:hypothetical protein
MPDKTLRRQILEVILARVAEIRTENGYATDAGQKVFAGKVVQLGPADPKEALAVFIAAESPSFQRGNVLSALPIRIIALVETLGDAPALRLEDAIGDIKRAMETADRTLGGLIRDGLKRGDTQVFDLQPGGTTTAASVAYFAPYVDGWGQP